MEICIGCKKQELQGNGAKAESLSIINEGFLRSEQSVNDAGKLFNSSFDCKSKFTARYLCQLY